MRKTNVKLKNKHGEDVTYEGVTTVSLESDDGTRKKFTLGELKTELIELDFSEGNQEVVALDTELYDRVIILVPDTFKPENIAEGVVIAGVEGTFEGARELPKLNAPTIARSADTITITNPNTNGNFNKSFNIYSNGELAFNQTGTTFSLIGKFEAEKDYTIEASCINPLMEESSKSTSINFSVFSIVKEFDEFLSTTDTTTKKSNNLNYSLQIKNAFGYWLPELIKVYKKYNDSDEYVLTDDYTYSMYTGEILIPAIDANIKIVAHSDEEPQLKRPTVFLDQEDHTLDTNYPRYAQKLLFYDCDELMHVEEKEEEKLFISVDPLGTTYTFVQGSDGFYHPNNTGRDGTFAIARINIINLDEETGVILNWRQSSETGYDYGLVGKIDVALSHNTNVDSNLLLNAKGRSVTNPEQITLVVPNGSHFFDVKYRKDGSVSSGKDMFEFKIEGTDYGIPIAKDIVTIQDDILYLVNNDYEKKKSANVTHHVYIDDELKYENKEGI